MTTNIDLVGARHRPRPGRARCVHASPGRPRASSQLARRRVDGAGDGGDRPGRPHRLVPVHRHRLAGRVGHGHRDADRRGPRRRRRRRPGRTRRPRTRASRSPSPCSPTTSTRSGRASRSSRSAPSRRRHRGDRRPARSRSRPSTDFFGTTSFIYRIRDGANIAGARVRGPGHGQRDRPAVGAGIADRGRRQRHGDRQLGRPAVQRRADRRLRDPHRRAAPASRSATPTGYTWTGLTNGAAGAVQRPGPQQRRLGPVERRRRPPSRPTSSPAGRPRRRCSSPTARCWCAGRRRPTRAARSPTTTSRSAAAPRPIQRVGAGTSFRWDGPAERQRVHVHGPGRERQGRGPVQLLVRARAPAAPAGRAGGAGRRARRQDDPRLAGARRATAATRSSSTRCRSSARAPRTRRRARRCSGPTCPTASRSSSRSAPATAAGGARRRRPSAPVIPCGVPDRVAAASGASAATGRRRVSWAAPDAPGLRDHRLHDRQPAAAVDERRRRRHVGDVRRADQRHQLHVHGHRHQRGRHRAPPAPASNAVIPAGPPCAPHDHAAPRPTPAGSPSRGPRPATTAAPITTYQLSVNGGAWENVGTGTSTTRTGLANSTHVHVPGAGRERRRPRRRRATRRRRRTPGEPDQVGGLGLDPAATPDPAPRGRRRPTTASRSPCYQVDIDPGGVADDDGRSHTFDGLGRRRRRTTSASRPATPIGCGPWSAWRRRAPRPPRSTSTGARTVGRRPAGLRRAVCRWVTTTATGLTPGQTYTVTCHGSRAGRRSATSCTADGSGAASPTTLCYFGYPTRRSGCTGRRASSPSTAGGGG